MIECVASKGSKCSLWSRIAYQVDKEDRDIRFWRWSRQVVRLGEACGGRWSTSCGEASVNRGVRGWLVTGVLAEGGIGGHR